MDWSKIDLPDPPNSRPQTGELGRLDYWKLSVASKLIKKSLAATLQTAVLTYLKQNWPDHEARLQIEASNKGLTVEEMFEKIAQGEIEI